MRALIALLSLAAASCHLLSGLDEPVTGEPSANGSVASSASNVSAMSSGGSASGGAGAGGLGGGGSCGVGGAVSSTYREAVLGDDPVGYWRLSDARGDDAADEVGCNLGEHVGAVTQEQPGALENELDTAVRFEGPNAGIRFDDIFDLQVFSIEVWINIPSGTTGYHWILSKMTLDPNFMPVEGYGLYFHDVEGLRFDVVHGGQHTSAQVLNMVFDTWHHVVGTYDGVNGTLYMNGMERDTFITSSPPIDHDGKFLIGAINDTGGGPFVGSLDEVAVYDHELSAMSVLEHYEAASN
jgi:hypothetical protein